VNGAVFLMKYDDKQEEQSVPTSQGTGQQTVVVNASEVEIMGLEVDFAGDHQRQLHAGGQPRPARCRVQGR
jgi:hypothetical protein